VLNHFESSLCCFDIGIDWKPPGLREGDHLRIGYDGGHWYARLLRGNLSANGLQIIGLLALYSPMVLRLGGAPFFVDDVPDPEARTVDAGSLHQRYVARTLSGQRSTAEPLEQRPSVQSADTDPPPASQVRPLKI
jgi:hypothetical protein